MQPTDMKRQKNMKENMKEPQQPKRQNKVQHIPIAIPEETKTSNEKKARMEDIMAENKFTGTKLIKKEIYIYPWIYIYPCLDTPKIIFQSN